jgi:hypothetical protein
MESEGRGLHTLLDQTKDPYGADHFVQLLDWLKIQKTIKMHVNVHVQKKSRFSSSSTSRRNSVSSSSHVTASHFGTPTLYATDILPSTFSMSNMHSRRSTGVRTGHHCLSIFMHYLSAKFDLSIIALDLIY